MDGFHCFWVQFKAITLFRLEILLWHFLFIQPLIPAFLNPSRVGSSEALLSFPFCIHCPGLCYPATSFAALLSFWGPELSTALWTRPPKRLFCSSWSSGAQQDRNADFAWFEGQMVIESANVTQDWKTVSPPDLLPGGAQELWVPVSSQCQHGGRMTAPRRSLVKQRAGWLAPTNGWHCFLAHRETFSPSIVRGPCLGPFYSLPLTPFPKSKGPSSIFIVKDQAQEPSS